MALLEINGIEVRYGRKPVLHDLTLRVENGECLALLGPSGCGKTTTLRAVAGFLKPFRGDVRVGGQSIAGAAPNKRNVGIVFQDYALFPHMSVGENVGYGLRMRGTDKSEAAGRVAEALKMVRLEDFAERYPEQLSGGQRQRVALARAIVIRPDVLLLDEPLGALDRKLRDAMQVELKQLQRALGITTIIVTHDQEEALSLSDRVAVMFDGRLEALGTPADVYERPTSLKVMDFIGAVNVIEGSVEGGRLDAGSGLVVDAALDGASTGERLRFGIRPEHVELLLGTAEAFACKVEEIVYKGADADVIVLAPDGRRFAARAPAARVAQEGIARGQMVGLGFAARHLMPVAAP